MRTEHACQSRAEQSRAEQSRAEQSRVRVIGSMDNRLDHTFESANRVYDTNCICPTIPTCGGGGIQPKVIEVKKIGFIDNGTGQHQSNTVYSPDGVSPGITTIEGGNVSPTLTTTTVPYVVELANPDFYNFLYEIDGELYLIRIRKLVPLECFRLMGVSNEDASKMLNVNSNTQCYKQAGNSIVVTVLMGIFSQLGISGCKKWNDMSDTEINQMIQKCR